MELDEVGVGTAEVHGLRWLSTSEIGEEYKTTVVECLLRFWILGRGTITMTNFLSEKNGFSIMSVRSKSFPRKLLNPLQKH